MGHGEINPEHLIMPNKEALKQTLRGWGYVKEMSWKSSCAQSLGNLNNQISEVELGDVPKYKQTSKIPHWYRLNKLMGEKRQIIPNNLHGYFTQKERGQDTLSSRVGGTQRLLVLQQGNMLRFY